MAKDNALRRELIALLAYALEAHKGLSLTKVEATRRATEIMDTYDTHIRGEVTQC